MFLFLCRCGFLFFFWFVLSESESEEKRCVWIRCGQVSKERVIVQVSWSIEGVVTLAPNNRSSKWDVTNMPLYQLCALTRFACE
ncbi:hypothetical protein BDE02_02G060500 [Populus trichocarpa]|nr:hypothetical protein BDE02_02G060500 [Populus trichocarpa]